MLEYQNGRYKLKGGEDWIDGVLHGWTGGKCKVCGGHGESDDARSCRSCAGTGDEWGIMPVQPIHP